VLDQKNEPPYNGVIEILSTLRLSVRGILPAARDAKSAVFSIRGEIKNPVLIIDGLTL
jgi:hypothetical protein